MPILPIILLSFVLLGICCCRNTKYWWVVCQSLPKCVDKDLAQSKYENSHELACMFFRWAVALIEIGIMWRFWKAFGVFAFLPSLLLFVIGWWAFSEFRQEIWRGYVLGWWWKKPR